MSELQASLCLVLSASLYTFTGGCARGDGSAGAYSECDQNEFIAFLIAIDARSSADPYVSAMLSTDGSLNFGPAQSVKAIVGGVLLACCLLAITAVYVSLGGVPAPPSAAFNIHLAFSVPFATPCRPRVTDAALHGAGAAAAATLVLSAAAAAGHHAALPAAALLTGRLLARPPRARRLPAGRLPARLRDAAAVVVR